MIIVSETSFLPETGWSDAADDQLGDFTVGNSSNNRLCTFVLSPSHLCVPSWLLLWYHDLWFQNLPWLKTSLLLPPPIQEIVCTVTRMTHKVVAMTVLTGKIEWKTSSRFLPPTFLDFACHWWWHWYVLMDGRQLRVPSRASIAPRVPLTSRIMYR